MTQKRVGEFECVSYGNLANFSGTHSCALDILKGRLDRGVAKLPARDGRGRRPAGPLAVVLGVRTARFGGGALGGVHLQVLVDHFARLLNRALALVFPGFDTTRLADLVLLLFGHQVSQVH